MSAAEFWYNTAYHSALGKTPFEVLYGHSPRHLGITNTSNPVPQDLEEWLADREMLMDVIKQQLHRACHRMKNQADKKRSKRVFEVNDLVYIRLQPYIQTSVAARSNQKLSYKYFRPFKILQKVGAVAYKVDLPSDARIHPVLHVSQLKKYVPPSAVVESDISILSSEDDHQPVRILESRLISRGSKTIQQLKVRWSNFPDHYSTWEEAFSLRRRYPDAPAWGQAGFEGVGVVMGRRQSKKRQQQEKKKARE